MMDRRMANSLDRYITGSYGEDQFKGETDMPKPYEHLQLLEAMRQFHGRRKEWKEYWALEWAVRTIYEWVELPAVDDGNDGLNNDDDQESKQ